MDVDGFRLPSPSQMPKTSSSTFIPTVGDLPGRSPLPPPRQPEVASGSKLPINGFQQDEQEVPESSLHLSSYTGAITLGLYNLEPTHTFKGATTLSGLVKHLDDIKGEIKRKVRR
jgi:hypothetical protein